MFSEEVYVNIKYSIFNFTSWFGASRGSYAPKYNLDTFGIKFKDQFRFYHTIYNRLLILTGRFINV